ncbi:mitochondrial carrier protein CoAc1-like isoform X1 [Zingiber officinale]|uniref:mitochondrial carrier protein CoAc1-like isoform X1 n=1 Tax=Zingiber officinale TaxID=94328 RepID=UPI001C4B6E87|nr:mitochondrial carrier protein CoAc1-like isoform X1 [Zingiber officinale]
MDTSQESTISSATAAAEVEFSVVDELPVYVKELIAGGAAGAFAKTAVAPLERLKILMQTRTEGFKSLGILESLRQLKQHEGFLGFYKGNGASVLRIIPYAALHYMTYEQYRCWILNNYSSLVSGPFVDLLAGSASGGTAVLCTYPLDLARTKLAYQVNNPGKLGNEARMFNPKTSYTGIVDVFKKVYMEGGMRSLFRGVGPTLVGIIPYAGLKFYIYEDLKSRVPEQYEKSVVLRLSCGALAGLFGQTLTYPLDVIRRQMQALYLTCLPCIFFCSICCFLVSYAYCYYNNMKVGVSDQYFLCFKVQTQQLNHLGGPCINGTLQGFSYILQTQGWRQLFAGLSLNYIKVVPSVAIGFTAYDSMKTLLRVPPREKPSSASAAST